MPFLKKLIFVLCALVTGMAADKAQAQSDARKHFIYIQSENQQPYYVIVNKKSYSSSSVGYLIVSKLADGDYNVTVGFPQDAYPASTYLLKINSNDAGFSLKKGPGNTWNMVDKLSQKALAVVNTGGGVEAAPVASSTDNTDKNNDFGDLLSKTSNDTTNYQAYLPTANAGNDNVAKATMPGSGSTTTAPLKKGGHRPRRESTAAANTVPETKKVQDDLSNESYETAAARSATQSIVKVGERSDRRGVSLAFVVTSGEKLDTVNAFFPGDSKNSILEDDDNAVATNVATTENVSPEKAALKKEVDNRKSTGNPFYKATGTTAKDNSLGLFSDGSDHSKSTANAEVAKEGSSAAKSQNTDSKEVFNSTCSSMVTDRDMAKIRKKMIAKSTDEEMIAVARKYIDTKCVYTAQIKELGGLLISDNGRFALYRILYPNVYDGSQFRTLEDQLLDKNYKAQFETLVAGR